MPIELDVEDPFEALIKPKEQAIPVEEAQPEGKKLDIAGIPAGIGQAITSGIPAMASASVQFSMEQMLDPRAAIERGAESLSALTGSKIELPSYLKAAPITKEIASPFEESKKFWEGRGEQYLKEHPERTVEVRGEPGTPDEGKVWREPTLGFTTGKMIGESLTPMGGFRKAALTGTSKLIFGAQAARKAAADYAARGMTKAAESKLTEATELSAKYLGRQAVASKVSNIGTAGLFGASQAQQTIDNARERGVTPGIMPYLTGMVEAAGEYLGTKYLNKLFKVTEEGGLGFSFDTIKQFFKTTFGVEVSTEMLQNGLEAAIEKYSGIRPEARPVKEAISAIAPTTLMSALTLGVAGGAHYTGKQIDKQIAKWNETQTKSITPIDMTQPKPVQKEFVPRAVTQPMTRAEKEYSDWWNEEMRKTELLRQSPEGRNRLAEDLAAQAGQRATIASEQERINIAKEQARIRKTEADIEAAKSREFLSREMQGVEEANTAEMKQKMEALKSTLAKGRAAKVQKTTELRMKGIAQTANSRAFGNWIDERVKAMNDEVDNSGTEWLAKIAKDYDVDPNSKNFISQLRRGIAAEAKISGVPAEVLEKKVTPKEPVSPAVETPITGEKPYAGLTPGTKEWKAVWKAHPELQGEMADIVKKGIPQPGAMVESKEEVAMRELREQRKAEALPKNQALKLIKENPITPTSTMNNVKDIFDGVDDIAVHYDMEIPKREELATADESTVRAIASKVQEIWAKTSATSLLADMQHKSIDIKEKIAASNKIIDEMLVGAKKLVLPIHKELAGRPRKAQEERVIGEAVTTPTEELPELPESNEETQEVLDDVEEEVQDAEPTEEELKEVKTEAEAAEEALAKEDIRYAREKAFSRELQLIIQRRKMKMKRERGITWEELENDIAEILDGIIESKEKEKEVYWKTIGEASVDFENPDKGYRSPEIASPLDQGTAYIHDGKAWEAFFDSHKVSTQPYIDPSKPWHGMIPGTKVWLDLKRRQAEPVQKIMTNIERNVQSSSKIISLSNTREVFMEAIRIQRAHTDKFKQSRAYPIMLRIFTHEYPVLDAQGNPVRDEAGVVQMRKLSDILETVPMFFVNDNSLSSHYDNSDDAITINIRTGVGTGADLNDTILHEAVHALSAYVLRYDAKAQAEMVELLEQAEKHANDNVKKILAMAREAERKATLGGKPVKKYLTSYAAQEVKRLQNSFHNRLSGIPYKDWMTAYALSDVYEFLAMASDSHEVQKWLKNINVPYEKQELSAWKKFMRWLHINIFKEAPTELNYSMWDKIMDASQGIYEHSYNLPQKRNQFREKSALGVGYAMDNPLPQVVKDIRAIGETNVDIQGWQKFIPMHILGKYFDQAKAMLNSWQEGQRTLNRILYNYEYTIDEQGKPRQKSFLTLSHPLKPNTDEQKLFDRMSYQADLEHREMTMDDLRGFNRTMGFNLSQDKLDKVQHAYTSIRQHYTRFWNWYWDNVQKVALRPHERKVWYTELVQTMLENDTQITPEIERDVKDTYGEVEWRRFQRARDGMLKAWDAIAKSRATMVAGYAPRMRQQGAYRVNIKDAAGNIIATEFATNRAQAAMLKYRMEKQHPTGISESFHVSTSPENVFAEFDKKDLESFVKTITDIMERAGEADEFQTDEFYEALSSHIANKFKPTGFRTHQIPRVGQAGSAIQGYKTENYHENYLAYIRNGAGSIRKMNFAFDANNILRDIKVSRKEGQSELFKYLRQYRDDMLRNEIAADKVISNVRSIAFLYYLAGNIKASAVNSTQNFILGIPIYSRAMRSLGMQYNPAKAGKDLHKAMVDVFRMKAGKKDHLTAEELDVLENGKMDGDTGAMQMSYMSGAMDRTFGSRYTYVVNMLGTPFSMIESVNREAALLAFYRLYRQQGMPEGMSYVKARENMYDVHFPYGKHNYPELVRAKGVLGQLGHLLSTFRSYSIMYVSTILESFRGTDGQISWKNADVFFGSIALLVMLGGLSAPWVDDILDAYERWTGRPIRSMIRERFRTWGGDRLAWVGMHGLPALIGVDITGSLKIGVPLIGAGGIDETIAGAYAGIENKLGKGYEAFSLENYYRALEEWSPAFISNAMKAVREMKEGATNIDGTPVTDPEMNQYRPNLPESVLSALGFRIERRAAISEEQRTYRNTEQHMAKRRDALYSRYRLAKTDADRDKVLAAIDEYNQEADELGNSVPNITPQTLKRSQQEKFDKRRYMFQLLFNEPAEEATD